MKNNHTFSNIDNGLLLAGQIAQVGYFEWDIANDRITWSDQQFGNHGYQPQAFVPTAEVFRSLTHPDDLERITEWLANVFQGQCTKARYRINRPDGSIRWLSSQINVINDEHGSVVKLFGITQDVTEQWHTEERLKKMEKDLIFTNQLYSRSTYLNKLIINDYPLEAVIAALDEFGIETQAHHCCFVIKLSEKHNSGIPDYAVNPGIAGTEAILIWLAENELGWIWKCNDDIVLLLPVIETNLGNKQSQLEFANQLISQITKLFPHMFAKVGISGISSIPLNLQDSYEKAYRAAVIATSMGYAAAVHSDDLGLYEVAFQLLHDQRICNLVENTIGKIAEYDQARGSSLLVTLEYLLEDMSLKMVGQKLFIHHNTAIWRKRRIETLLDMSLDKIETKVLLILYFKIWNLLKIKIDKKE
jgi:PAS domain S-box-containing protein